MKDVPHYIYLRVPTGDMDKADALFWMRSRFGASMPNGSLLLTPSQVLSVAPTDAVGDGK